MSNSQKYSVVRLGDSSSHGGRMISASSIVKYNSIAGCLDQDIHSCPFHGNSTVTATGKIKTNGKNTVVVTDVAGCGAVLTTGSPNIKSSKKQV